MAELLHLASAKPRTEPGRDFLQAVFDALDAGVIVLDRDQRVVAWNAWLVTASNVSAERAKGKTLAEIFPDAPLRVINAALATAVGSGTSTIISHTLHPKVFPLRTRAGRELLHNISIGALGSDAPFSCMIQIVDITLATGRELLLRKRQNARYDAVVASASDAIITVDAEGLIQLANPAAARQFGYTTQEFVGLRADILFQDQNVWIEKFQSVMGGAVATQPIEVVAKRKDGSATFLEISLSRWESETRAFATAILRDVNERRLADAALRASETQFRTLAQAMPNQVWSASPSGEAEWRNDRLYEYTGLTDSALNRQAVVHPEDIEHFSRQWDAARLSGEPFEVEFRMRRHDGSYRWHITRAVPIQEPDGAIKGWIGTNTDIEAQKVAAEVLADLNVELEQRVVERTSQLVQTEEALRQSQKMEAVGQLTGGIAHDFNNLLQGIIGSLDRVRKRISEGRLGDVDRFLGGALGSANRAAALTHRLLAFSRRQPVDARPIALGQLIAEMEELLRRSLGENLELKVAVADDLWLVRCDENQLENALLNLAINARDAMPSGGRLEITCSNVALGAVEARQRDLTSGDYVRIRVSDTGAGMPAEVKARAFDPFFTTKPIGQGTGLGLSMIYGFVRQSDGSTRIESEVDKGTTIEICLPRYHGPAEQQGAAPLTDDPKRAGREEVILVAEDEGIIRLLIVETLAELGYRVLEAPDGPSALRICQSSQRVDLLVTDIGLPGLNGRQVADAARALRPGLHVLFMTGYAENAAGKSFLEPGMEIITKPFDMDALAKRIQTMIARSR